MAAVNSFYDPENGWMAMDQMSPAQLALLNPGAYGNGYSSMPMQMDLIPTVNNQGTTVSNLGPSNPVFDAAPTTYAPYTGSQAAPQVDPAASMPAAAPAAQQYANSLPTGSESINGVGMYTGSNGPLDTNRFNPQTNLDFVRSIDQSTYHNYVLPFQQSGGDITNPAAVRQAIEQGMRQRGGGTYAVGSQTFNIQGQPVQQTGPNPPLQVAPLPSPPQASQPQQQPQQPAFNPAMAYRLPQPTSPSNPFASMLQNPFQQQNPFGMRGTDTRPEMPAQLRDMVSRGLRIGYDPTQFRGGPDPTQYAAEQQRNAELSRIYTMMQPGGGALGANIGYNPSAAGGMLIGQPSQQQNPQLQLMIANAMARGAFGQGGGYGSPNNGFGGYQNPAASQQISMALQNGWNPNQLYPQMGSAPRGQQNMVGGYPTGGLDPGPQQAQRGTQWDAVGGSFSPYNYNDLTEYGRQQLGFGSQQPATTDFRAATFGGGTQQQQPASTSYASQFSAPGSSASPTTAASDSWANVGNTLPSASNSYSYLWGR